MTRRAGDLTDQEQQWLRAARRKRKLGGYVPLPAASKKEPRHTCVDDCGVPVPKEGERCYACQSERYMRRQRRNSRVRYYRQKEEA